MRVRLWNFGMLMLVGSLALSPGQVFAGEMAQQQQQQQQRKVHVPEGLRPDKNVRLSHQKPEMLKPTAKATSWGDEHTVQIDNRQRSGQYSGAPGAGSQHRDPYRIELNNYNTGTKITVSKEQAPDAIQMPAEERINVKSAAFRKQVNAQYNHDLAKGVATARKEVAVTETTANGPSSSQQAVIENAAQLATKSRLTIRATDSFGRKYKTIKTQVNGLADDTRQTREPGYVDRGNFVPSASHGAANGWADRITTDRKSGQLAPVEPLYIQRANLKVTPVFEEVQAPKQYTVKDRLQRQQQGIKDEGPKTESFVKLLSLAAFPRSGDAVIKVTNTRLEGEGKENTWEFKQNGTGSGTIKVPAKLGDKLRVTVIDNPAVGGTRQQAQPVTTEVVIPRGGKAGVDYEPVDRPAAAAPAQK